MLQKKSDPGHPELFFPCRENSCRLPRLYRKNLENLVQKLEPAQDHALRDWFLAECVALSLRRLKSWRGVSPGFVQWDCAVCLYSAGTGMTSQVLEGIFRRLCRVSSLF